MRPGCKGPLGMLPAGYLRRLLNDLSDGTPFQPISTDWSDDLMKPESRSRCARIVSV